MELFTPSIAIVTQLEKLHQFSHLALETSLQCNCSSKYSAGYAPPASVSNAQSWKNAAMAAKWFNSLDTNFRIIFWTHELAILLMFFMDGPLDSPDEAGLLLQPKLRTALGGKIDGWINFPLSLTPSWLWQCLPNCVTTIMEFSYQLAQRDFYPQKISLWLL